MHYRIVSWNLLFDSYLLAERTTFALEYILAVEPSIICLQEVRADISETIVEILASHGYYLSAKQLQLNRLIAHRYSTLIFSKEVGIITVHKFPQTHMGRDILEYKLGELYVVNVHLESMGGKQFDTIRQQQLTELNKLYKEKQVVICGDFNIAGSITTCLSELYIGVNTYHANRVDSARTQEYQYDKVLYAAVECEFLKLIGNQQYSANKYCSDHDGLLFTVHTL